MFKPGASKIFQLKCATQQVMIKETMLVQLKE
jgi:hypothetical protein